MFYILCVNEWTSSTQRVFNQKEFYCSILKSFRDQLQEYAIKKRISS